MPKLTDEQKRFIVMELACDYTPSEVAEHVKEVFGVDVDRRQVHEYNPERLHSKPVAEKWRRLFEVSREEYEKSAAAVPIAKKAFRLRELNDLYRRAKQRGNDVLAAQHLEQAAKESGGSYTNRRELTGKDGRDLPAGGAVVILPAKSSIEDH